MTDYIEREAALSAQNKSMTLNEMRKRLERIPSADVRPVVRGQWKSHGEGFKWVYICSSCGYVDGYPLNDRMPFCPNCGADMREGNDAS